MISHASGGDLDNSQPSPQEGFEQVFAAGSFS